MDPNVKKLQEHIAMEYEETFMMYLPRICEHCLNPSCVASCPSGALYKREEDGVVLVTKFITIGIPIKRKNATFVILG